MEEWRSWYFIGSQESNAPFGTTLLVPTLRVGMPSWPLRGLRAGRKTTRSVEDGIPKQSLGTRTTCMTFLTCYRSDDGATPQEDCKV